MNKKKIMILSSILLIAGISTASYFLYFKNKSDIEYEDNATIGVMPGIDIEKRREELQKKLDESVIAFSINTSPVFASGASEGNLMIENPEQNQKLIVAQIKIDNYEQPIYESKYIKPGSYIENIKLNKVLDKGTYDAIAYFKAYNQETRDYIGETSAKITITVQS